MEKQKKNTGHIFDDTFRTMEEHLPKLVIPLINEAFGTRYPPDTRVTRVGGRHHRMGRSNEMDSSLTVEGKAYHFECESNPRKRIIIIRMFEYDLSAALDNITREDGVTVAQMPNSCLLYLRHNKETKDRECLLLRMSDGREIEYTVPVIKTQNYSKIDIFEKKLYMLLPFYILKYEKLLPKMKADGELKQLLLKEYEDILKCMERELLPEDAETYAELHQLMQHVMDYVLRQNKDIQEGVKQIMGGKVLESYREKVFKEGLATGLNAMITMLKGYPLEEVYERICASETAYQDVSFQEVKQIYERVNA